MHPPHTLRGSFCWGAAAPRRDASHPKLIPFFLLRFSFFTRDDDNHIIAGANGYVIYGVIYTDQLWVDRAYRNQGLARVLMEKVHQFGLTEGCRKASVSTMSFQKARDFYEKLGYQVNFERTGHVNESSCYFMSKNI